MGNTIHFLKVRPESFEAILKGDKNSEVQEYDRDYKAGDLLYLQEWNGEYTGRRIVSCITWVHFGGKFLREGYVIISFRIEKIIKI